MSDVEQEQRRKQTEKWLSENTNLEWDVESYLDGTSVGFVNYGSPFLTVNGKYKKGEWIVRFAISSHDRSVCISEASSKHLDEAYDKAERGVKTVLDTIYHQIF